MNNLDKNGQETDVYLLNEYIVATMDYYIACCIFASIPQCRDQYIVFEEQVALYKALNGTNGRHNGAPDVPQVVGSEIPSNVKVEPAYFD